MRKLTKNIKAMSNLVPMVLAVIIAFAVLFIGVFVNGEINDSLTDTYPSTATERSNAQNLSYDRLGNISENQDSAIDIVQVVIIITVLAGAIAAIFLFTRFR